MTDFLKEIVKGSKFELLIDTKIYKKDIVFKTAYLFLDKGYFFFKEDNKNLIVQFKLKEDLKIKAEEVIRDFNNELLNNMLRGIVSKENKVVREEIITSSIKNSLREAELPNDWKGYEESDENYFNNREKKDNEGEIDFDKDIDEILKEIENDPELKIDEKEIDKILKEIEDESIDNDNDLIGDNKQDIEKDKSLDELLEEVENDSELKIDEKEINEILKEIEDESIENEQIKLDLEGVKKAKKQFKK